MRTLMSVACGDGRAGAVHGGLHTQRTAFVAGGAEGTPGTHGLAEKPPGHRIAGDY